MNGHQDASPPVGAGDQGPPLHIDAPGYQGPERRLEMREWRSHVDARLNAGSITMQALQTELEKNTQTTERVETNTGELVGLLQSFKGAFVVLEKLGKLAKPLSYIAMLGSSVYGLLSVLKGGGAAK
jgi:hypothetical protein